MAQSAENSSNRIPLSAERRFSFKRLVLSLFLTLGYGSLVIYMFLPLVYVLAVIPLFVGQTLCAVLWLTAVTLATRHIYRNITRRGSRRAVIAAEILVFIIFPIVGTLFNWWMPSSCAETDCDTFSVHRVFALPQFARVFVLHALTVLAYAISRKRGELLPTLTELLVLGGMVGGCVIQIALGAQLGVWLVYGLAGAPIMFFTACPIFGLVLFLREIRNRVIRHATRFDVIVQMLGSTTGLLGLYTLIEASIGRHRGAVFDVFTRTCGHTFSQLPIVHLPCTGHYLCTVAACGHPKLVRPLRLGQRGGEPIIVNRQLAIANAFEDLLHERFPRFGRAARCTYDRIGYPISRWVRHRLVADVTYLLMKPAEWVFYAFLLLFDPRDPEDRLARMYPWK